MTLKCLYKSAIQQERYSRQSEALEVCLCTTVQAMSMHGTCLQSIELISLSYRVGLELL